MTPSPNDKPVQTPPTDGGGDSSLLSADDTPQNLRDETPRLQLDLPDNLTSQERAKATSALKFLDDVRHAARDGNQLPQSIGRYSIIRSLGRGGFAEVFLAEDCELDRRVALKVPLFNTTLHEESRQRFEREARLAATLGHPQIIPVYEFGTVGPLRFIAFAWCDGTTLTEWMEQNSPIEFRTAAEIICHLADAVQHAHQRGIIHRDLKPGNVLVETSDNADKPIWKRTRITDFGLARSTDTDATVLTQDGRIVGTPAYMSPEQAASESGVGPAADVWALGMMLFELLTGQLPFRRDDMLATVRAITDDPLPRARTLRSDVPKNLEAIADLCLRKSPADRYQSAHELAEDLRRWLNNEPVRARPLSAAAKAGKWVRRNPIVAGAIGITIASLSLGLGLAIWQRNEAIANLQEAQTQTSRADGNLQTAQTLIKDIIALETKLRSQGQLSEERAALVSRAAELQLQLVDDEVQTPQMRYDTAISLRELSALLSQLQQYEEAIENAHHVLTLLEGLENNLPQGLSTAQLFELRIQQRIKIASCLNMVGKTDEAASMFDAADAEPVPLDVTPLQRAVWLSTMRQGRAQMLAMSGDRAASAAQLEVGLAYFEDIDPPNDNKQRWNYFITTSQLNKALGFDKSTLNQLDSAAKHFATATKGLDELSQLFPDHPMLANEKMLLSFLRGTLAEQQADWSSACEHYAESRNVSLDFFEQNKDNLNPANVYVMATVALCRSQKNNGSPDEARDVAKETIATVKDFPESVTKNSSYQDNIEVVHRELAVETE